MPRSACTRYGWRRSRASATSGRSASTRCPAHRQRPATPRSPRRRSFRSAAGLRAASTTKPASSSRPRASPASGWPVSLLLSDVDEVMEQEPNNDLAHANRVPVPCGISGRFQEKSDIDCFVFAAKKGQRYLIDAQTQELLSPADVYMVLKDAK